MNRGLVLIAVVTGLSLKITRRCYLTGANHTVGGQETTGTGWEAEARNCKLFAGRDLRIGVCNLFEMRLEAADRRQPVGLYGLELCGR